MEYDFGTHFTVMAFVVLTVIIIGMFVKAFSQVNCPQCREKIDKNATKCPHCSSDIPDNSD